MRKMAYIAAMQGSLPKSTAISTLKKRNDFLRLRHGEFARPKGFYLQASPNEDRIIRVGYTATKRLGNAVTRNKAKRRLRAVAQDVIAQRGQKGWDYVLIAKDHTLTRAYEDLCKDAKWALHQIHKNREEKA